MERVSEGMEYGTNVCLEYGSLSYRKGFSSLSETIGLDIFDWIAWILLACGLRTVLTLAVYRQSAILTATEG